MAGVILRYRICYQKNDDLIFISHLDLQKMFQRAFRRAKIDLAYSEGFNPHPKMSYSPPLSLFVSSAEEYLDVYVSSGQDTEEIKIRLSEVLPDSIVINHVELLDNNADNLSDLIVWGEYEIILHDEGLPKSICDDIKHYYESNEAINVTKRNKKKKLIQKNIKPNIKSFDCVRQDNNLYIKCELSLRNNAILNPNYIVKALRENLEILKDAKIASIRKTKVLLNNQIAKA